LDSSFGGLSSNHDISRYSVTTQERKQANIKIATLLRQKQDIVSWTSDDVVCWAKAANLEQVVGLTDKLKQMNVTGEVLISLNE